MEDKMKLQCTSIVFVFVIDYANPYESSYYHKAKIHFHLQTGMSKDAKETMYEA
jgi:hypothetical protein